MANTERENFRGSLTAVMAMAGSAIGLGNIWRFPYMVGQNGGAAFIIIYLLSALFLSMPIFLSESMIGKKTHQGTFGAMEQLAPGTRWKWMGLLTVCSSLVILSYYSVVGGWSINYLCVSVGKGFSESSVGGFGSFISSTWSPLLFHTLFMASCAVIVSAGVKDGIEKFNKYTMPLLFVLIVVLMVYAISLPGARAGVEYLLKPDFSKLTASSVAAAMGQSFFSLSLGVGTILTYSSYMKKSDNVLLSGVGTAGFDLLFALLAGFAIMPAVFAAGVEPGAGPGLIFETLPYIFVKMGATMPVLSRVVAILFFVTILFAAMTSAISMFEVGVAYLVENKGMGRRKATTLLLVGCWAVGIVCSLSFGPLSFIQVGGRNIFDMLDHITSDYLMAFGGMLFTLFVGWKVDRQAVRDEFTDGGRLKFNAAIFDAVYFMIKWVAPVVILVIFVTNLVL